MANQVYSTNQQPYSGDFWYGTPEYTQQMSLYNPEQEAAMNTALSRGLQGATQQFDFAPIEQQARTGFAQKTLPSIAERFAGLGQGGQRSSAFYNTLGQAGQGLEESLAAMKQNYNLQMMPMMQQLMGMGLNRRFENAMHQRVPGFLETGGSALLGGLGQALGTAATGGLGSMGALMSGLNGVSNIGQAWANQAKQNTMFGPGNYSPGAHNFGLSQNYQFGQFI